LTGKDLLVSILFLIMMLPLCSAVFAADNTTRTEELNTSNVLHELSENPAVSNATKKVIKEVSNQPIVQQAYSRINNSPYTQPAVSSMNLYLSLAQEQGILLANMLYSLQQSFITSQAATVQSIQQIPGFQ